MVPSLPCDSAVPSVATDAGVLAVTALGSRVTAISTSLPVSSIAAFRGSVSPVSTYTGVIVPFPTVRIVAASGVATMPGSATHSSVAPICLSITAVPTLAQADGEDGGVSSVATVCLGATAVTAPTAGCPVTAVLVAPLFARLGRVATIATSTSVSTTFSIGESVPPVPTITDSRASDPSDLYIVVTGITVMTSGSVLSVPIQLLCPVSTVHAIGGA